MNGSIVVLLALAAASAFGLWRQRTDGRIRISTSPQPQTTTESAFAKFGELGERATIVQFSARVCAPCRAAALIATDIATQVPGVSHIEISAEDHMDLVREFGVLRTPTLLVLDGQARISARISGVPRKDELLVAIDDRRFEDI